MVNTWDIATREEVMAFWTEWMRSDEVSFVQRMKASELLARAYGIFRVAAEPELVQYESRFLQPVPEGMRNPEKMREFEELRADLLRRASEEEESIVGKTG